ncbi:uncharacterized protein LOC125940312 [Dermacentor silvarum]|uniref:uncharacterized protein LOC125940312 n=1 Tax=Dermacentor silvarum TaxID=543639 RepID=UPI002101264E|nr:uncharacterized protein LOC125940312 [Dermacentor silvarum]
MHKPALVVIFILMYSVPLLAWPKFIDGFFRRGKLVTTPRPGPRHRNYSVHIPRCDGGKYGTCIYPLMCSCPKPKPGGYIRSTMENSPWYYDNRTKTCNQTSGDPSGCNSFISKQQCLRLCPEVKTRNKGRRKQLTQI